jgi:hypothetical protein
VIGGFVLAHLVNKDPRGHELLAEVDARIGEFTDRMGSAYREQEARFAGVVEAVGQAAGEAAAAAKDAASDALDAAKDTASDAFDAAKDTASQAADAAEDAAKKLTD